MPQLLAQGFAEAEHIGFRRTIDGHAGARLEGCGRGHEHDPAATPCHHVGQDEAGELRQRHDVDRQHRPEALRLGGREGARIPEPGIVDEDLERPRIARLELCHELRRRTRARKVQRDDRRRGAQSAQLGRERRKTLRPARHEHEIAATATDTITFEVFPWDPSVPGAMMPMHCIHLVDMGLTQGQNWDLEELAADCAADGQYDFFLEASPQPFVGGVGSPVNPVAIK